MDESTFKSGDAVRVFTKIQEGDKVRTQIFPGTVIAVRGNSANRTFTVRRKAKEGVFVERIFPYPSPWIEKVQVVKKGKVRRSKLYYLRKKEFAAKERSLRIL